jgi:hypothetical protein
VSLAGCGPVGKLVIACEWCLAPCQMSQPACSPARYSKRWLILIVLLQCTLFTCRQDTVTLILSLRAWGVLAPKVTLASA